MSDEIHEEESSWSSYLLWSRQVSKKSKQRKPWPPLQVYDVIHSYLEVW